MDMIPAPSPGDWDYRAFVPIPFDRFRSELLALYEPPMRSPRTRDKLKFTLDILARLIGPGGMTSSLDPTLIARFLAGRPAGESPWTTKGLLGNVRTACSYARSQGYIRTSPFDFRRKWIRVGAAPKKRHHPLEDIRRVLELLAREVVEGEGWPRWRARRLQAVAATVAYCGLRRDEALGLLVGDVDLDGRTIDVVARSDRRLKTESSAQPVPMPLALVPILESWLARRMDPHGIYLVAECDWLFPNVSRSNRWKDGPQGHTPLDVLKAAGERAGVAGLTFQSLRHSWATHAESAWGLSPATIQRVLRHTSPATQSHYRHADMNNLRAATRGIDFGPPAPGPDGGPTP